MEMGPWQVVSLDHSDTKWGLSRSIINVMGRYENDRYPHTFKSLEEATAAASVANKDYHD